MIEVHDYSHLKPEEAREKIIHLTHRIFAEQFHKSFFVRDPRPEYYLKYEIHAYLSGTIEEFHGWTDPIGQALNFVYSSLTWWFRDFWYYTIRPGIEWILRGFKWIWDLAVEWARSAYNKALDVWYKLVDVYNYVRYTIYSTLQNVYNFLRGIGSIVYSKAREAINIVWDWLVRVWNDYIRPGVSAIVSGFKWLWEQASNFARSAFEWAKNAYNLVKDAWNSIVERVSGTFEMLSKQVAALPQAIAAAFKDAISYLSDVLKTVWKDIIKPYGKELAVEFKKALEPLIVTLTGIFDDILSALARYSPITPDRGWSAAKTLAVLSLTGSLATMTAAVGAELLHPLKRLGMTEVVKTLQDNIGLTAIGSFIAGAVMGAAVQTPLKYYVNAVFRPVLPDLGTAHSLLGRYSLSEKEFKEFMAWYGVQDKYYWMYAELGTSPSPTMTLRYYSRYVGLKPEEVTYIFNKLQSGAELDVRTETNWFLRELLRMGRSPEWMRAFTQLCLVESTRQVRDQYAREILRDYEYGYITKDELESELRAVGYPEQQRKLLLQFAEVRADRRDVDEHVKALQYSYRRGKITIDEFRAGLASLGIREDKISRLVAIELARAKEEVGSTQEEEVRAYGRGTAIKRFREGLITEAELEQELRMLGYSPQWIERLKTVARLERDYDFAMTVLRYVKTAYRKGKIDDTRFIELLRSYGFTDEKIMLELSLLKLAYGLGIEEEEVAS